MSIPLSGYESHRILRASERSRVYEATRKRDGKRVVAKVFQLGDPGTEARVEQEFQVLQSLDLDGVVQALSLERAGDQLVLLLDYIPGHNLAEHLGGQAMSVERFMPAALSLTRTLAEVHGRKVIHRDIKPSNILVDRRGQMFLADFGISVLLENARRFIYDPEVLAGTLPYLAPEQTGRTQRSVDFRSDLYSLGVTFYEMLTGRRPFEATEPLELIHAHLARRPKSIRVLVPELPRQLSAIVAKLLRKAPEHRYQSARGLLIDLEEAEAMLRAGEDGELPLGEHDHPTTLQLPRQLYGRATQQRALTDELAKTVEARSRRLVIIEGAPGLGKSALLHELSAPLSSRGGSLVVATCVRDGSDRPYRPFVEAFEHQIQQLLAQSEERLVHWRLRLREALGGVAPVVVELIPSLALVIGEQPPAPALALGEAHQRLRLALSRLAGALASEGPLALAIDDLHHADASDVALLRALLEGGEGDPVLLVVTLLDPDPPDGPAVPDDSAALREALDELAEDHPRAVRVVQLESLGEGPLGELLSAVLGREREELGGLTELVARKTGGVPLFIRELLVDLHDQGLIRPTRSGWEWDLDAIAAAPAPDDAVDLLASKLGRLPEAQRLLLGAAACVGVRFELTTLTAVLDEPASELAPQLLALEQLGLLIPAGAELVFGHARLAEFARAQLSDTRRRAIRGALGRHLLAQVRETAGEPEGLGEQVFAIADALAEGYPHAAGLDDRWRLELAAIAVEAGERALSAAAWIPSLRYLDRALELLSAERKLARAGRLPLDDDARAQAFAAAFARAQAAALAGEVEDARAAFDELLDWPLTDSERGRIAARKVRVLTLDQQLERAVEVGLESLDACGIRLPRAPKTAHLVWHVLRTSRRAKRASLEELLAAPPCEDPRIYSAIEIVGELKHASLVVNLNLFVIVTVLHARLVLDHGFHPTAAEGLSQLAISMAGFGDVAGARALSEIAIALAEQRSSRASTLLRTRAAALLFAGPRFRSFAECAQPIEDAARQALELGERENAGYYGALGIGLHTIAGTHLREVLELEPRLRRELPDWGTAEMRFIAEMNTRYAQALVARKAPPQPFLTRSEADGLEISRLTQYISVIVELDGRLLLGMAAGRLRSSQRKALLELIAPICGDFTQVLFGVWQLPRFAMLWSMLLVEHELKAPRRSRRKARRIIRKNLKILRKWAADCPENFAAMAQMCAGELALLEGEPGQALADYEAAQRLASDHGMPYMEGLSSLRIASLAERQGWDVVARGGRSHARKVFERWGAFGMSEQLERRETAHSHAIPLDRSTMVNTSVGVGLHGAATSSSSVNLSLDMATLLGTLRRVSEKLDIEDVLTTVLSAAIENAGADRGLLLLEREGELALVAEGDSGRSKQFMASPVPLHEARGRIPASVVHYAVRTREPLVLADLLEDSRFSADPYAQRSGVRSLLCVPILKRQTRIGALVLENHLVDRAFSSERLELIRVLMRQAASALDNARLYAALASSEAQWRSLVDGSPDIVALIDEHGHVEFVNHLGQLYASGSDAATRRERHLALARQLRGTPAEALVDPSGHASWREACARAQSSHEAQELELCLRTPKAPGLDDLESLPTRWHLIRIAPIEIPSQRSDRSKLLFIATDVSERKQLEAKNRQQQRLESIGTLASGVAHEINNPVQGILNYAELVRSHPDDRETVLEFTDEISTEAKRVAVIVRNLLAFSRQEQDRKLERVSVEAIVQGTLSLLRAVLRKDQVTLSVELDPALPELRCRPQQIQQIVMNLVTNARDALNERYAGYDPGKTIDILASAFEREGAGWIRIEVRDAGAGMPEHVRARIFDPFYTTKGRDNGTGLGLSVSHGIVTEHGGELSVESAVDEGTRFFLDLPIAGPET
ncbi:Serine/Threonine protein kinase and Signal Transduction Histidine Kinase (STHK) with GAF sensor [Plesiocystis pacifica SIR-1]|uniref:histidine kinase n=1 Tax=Plesiocystis pacifica SIR-1 TaxID=391625 RepID=A6GB99_9BACT|nr:AAA family ATPase [Plesiocystis pacifica]EDM76808.1 Serine/Threonine protein kinase and Signal Transduction Histidine Kinase (STHK) with GAF sensor [Plesiocystis pacifica SIR-1]